jgi:flagellar basal-body rod protein FlgF
VSPTYMSFEQGPLQQTNRPLDVALMGEGFLAVRDGDRTVYTRDGALAINAQGELVMASGGREVLSEADAPIRVPDGRAGEVRIAEDGRVMLGNAEIARLHLVNFADKQSLVKLGSNLYAAGDQAATATAATLQPGALERSTVDPTTTMVAMIEASRAYQLNAQMISMQDTILGRAVNDIATIE